MHLTGESRALTLILSLSCGQDREQLGTSAPPFPLETPPSKFNNPRLGLWESGSLLAAVPTRLTGGRGVLSKASGLFPHNSPIRMCVLGGVHLLPGVISMPCPSCGGGKQGSEHILSIVRDLSGKERQVTNLNPDLLRECYLHHATLFCRV